MKPMGTSEIKEYCGWPEVSPLQKKKVVSCVACIMWSLLCFFLGGGGASFGEPETRGTCSRECERQGVSEWSQSCVCVTVNAASVAWKSMVA